MKSAIKSLISRLVDPTFVPHDSYSLVLVMFNCALLMHFGLRGDWLIFLAVFFLFFNIRLLVVSIFQIVIALILALRVFPRQANHANMEVFIGFIIVALFALKLFRVKLNISSELVSYVFRVVTFLMYFCAGFHKLNADFLNNSVSCVNSFGAERWAMFFEFLGSGAQAIYLSSISVICLTLFVEIIVPFGLFWARTRVVSVIILFCFHMYLVFFSLASFSALSIFFLLASSMNFGQSLTAKQLLGARLYMICVMLFTVRYSFAQLAVPGVDSEGVIVELSDMMFAICSTILFYLFFKGYKAIPISFQWNYIPTLVLVAALMSFWALKNYVGLGSHGNLTMFSNLVTEKSRSNHLLIDTKRTKIWGFEEDYVQLLTLDKRLTLQEVNDGKITGVLLPVVEFGFLIKGWARNYRGKIACTLIYKGQKVIIDDLRTSPFGEYHWWYRFIPFRVIQLDGPNKCRW